MADVLFELVTLPIDFAFQLVTLPIIFAYRLISLPIVFAYKLLTLPFILVFKVLAACIPPSFSMLAYGLVIWVCFRLASSLNTRPTPIASEDDIPPLMFRDITQDLISQFREDYTPSISHEEPTAFIEEEEESTTAFISPEDVQHTLSLDSSGFIQFNNLPSDGRAPVSSRRKGFSKHYYLLGTIDQSMSWIRPMYHVRDKSGTKFLVAFHTPNQYWRSFENLAPGTMLCFSSPKKHWFMDGQAGIRVEDPEAVVPIPFGLSKLRQLNDYLRKNKKKCKRCGANATQRCTRCHIWYCSEGCQKKDWGSTHQRECRVIVCLRDANNAIAG